MTENQTIAYISDIAADYLKPLFITGCVVTTVFLDLVPDQIGGFGTKAAWCPTAPQGEKVLSGLTIACAVVGAAGRFCYLSSIPFATITCTISSSFCSLPGIVYLRCLHLLGIPAPWHKYVPLPDRNSLRRDKGGYSSARRIY